MNDPLTPAERRELYTLRSVQRDQMLKEAWIAGEEIHETFEQITQDPKEKRPLLDLDEQEPDAEV